MDSADLVDLLCCAALEPSLGGILFVDLDPRLISPYAELLSAAVHVVHAEKMAPVLISADTTDDQLWPNWGVTASAEGTLAIGARPGLIRRSHGSIFVVPDLARAGMPVLRAILTTLGTDVVHVERPGVSECWPARTRWLAACAGRDLAVLSPHLLDRFPVRVDGRVAPRTLDPNQVEIDRLLEPISRLQRRRPLLPADLIDALLHIDVGRPSIRRSLAVARLARALAERRMAEAVDYTDIVRAAELIGVTRANHHGATHAVPPAFMSSTAPPIDDHTTPTVASTHGDANHLDTVVRSEPASAVSEFEPTVEVAALDALHPEDDANALPEPRSLQWAVTGRTVARRCTGTIVGNEPTTDLHDLAIVPTLLKTLVRTWSAAERSGGSVGKPVVGFHDLRRHRRQHGPRHALVLVLDHSVRRDWDASAGLAPHLRWAYDQGAAVSVIEFGHADSQDELRPEWYRARSIADPQILTSLRRQSGAASPLAAAIELAAEELRRQMRRGWAPVRSARLVLVTDGRGNVPLDATAERRVTTRVARQGIEDSLTTAHDLALLHRVFTTVIAPIDEQYPALTADLALALGGTVTYVDDAPLVGE